MERVIDSRKKIHTGPCVGPSEPKSPCPARKCSSSRSARGRNRQREREREREKVIASSRINARAVGGDQFEFPTPRLSLVSGEGRASPPRLPRVGARGGPVCRGQVRGSCPPGATLPTTAVGTRVVGAAWIRLVGGSRAARRYSGARSTNSQSSLAIRGARRSSMVTRC